MRDLVLGDRRDAPEKRSDPLAETVSASGERARTEPDPATVSVGPTLDAQLPSTLPEAPADVIDPRYRTLREIGHGGMGRVLLAEDTRLGRRVALKTRLTDAASARAVLRFVEEARATAQLEHPSIVPVYDLADDARRQPFFSMRYVEGRSLAEVLDALHAGDAPTEKAFGASELVHVFLKICEAVAYAHHRGVLHRDLKPDNVMLGRFGEVFVMDWGLARVGEMSDAAHDSGEHQVSSVRDSAALNLTQAGTILGTPGYMSPEQVRGDPAAIDARSDVWALGAILYEIVTLRPAIGGASVVAMLADTALGKVVPPRRRAPERRISEGLEAIVMHALAVDPARRIQSAKELRDAVAAELEGALAAARRRAAAEAKLQVAEAHVARHRESRSFHDELRARLDEEAAGIGTAVEDLPRRRALWRRQADAEVLLADTRRAFWDAYGALVGAVEDDAGFERAREALVGLLLDRAKELRETGDREAAVDLVAIARQHDAARVAVRLEALAIVELRTDPPGARVRVSRFEEEGPLLVEKPCSEGHVTPCTLRLAPGSYVLDLEGDGRPEVRAPVAVEPGETRELDVWIPEPGVVPDGFAYVPGGRYVVGGDRLAPGSEPRRVVTIESFAIARHLVTMSEYAEFLNALAAYDPPRAAQHAPRVANQPYWTPEDDGVYRVPWKASDGDVAEADFPVCMLSSQDADAYAEWRGLRLPTSEEWEIAARGADDRIYPWGSGFDPALCWMRDTQSRPNPRPIGRRPLDRSVFGLVDVVGLVREITAAEVPAQRRARRSGAWSTPALQCRIGARIRVRDDTPYVQDGIRLACDVLRGGIRG